MSQPPPSALARPSSSSSPAHASAGAPNASSLARPEDRYRPVVYQPSRLWRWLYDRFFRHLRVDEGWERTVREQAARGLVVYVARSLSFLDFLSLDYLTKKHGLPLLRFTNDVGMSLFEPFGRGSRRMRLRRQIPDDRALEDTIREGHSSLLFLRRPPRMAARGRKGDVLDVDLIRTLVEMQRRIDKPIVLVPQTFVWTKRPASTKRSWIDLLFGPAEWPGRIRVFLQFLFNYKNALLRSGEPFDVGAFLEEHQDMTDAQAADAIRYALLRRIERERTLVLGPAKKTSTRIVSELMRSPRVRRNIEAAAKDGKHTIAELEQDARRDLEKLCAAPDTNWIELFHRFVDRFLWNRIYDGLVVDLEGLERVREAARRGPLVLLPSHKSHVDYLMLSDVLYVNGLAPPLIAAGDNLSFWPLGVLLRRSGAFFIKRSFKGKKLYPQLVDAYIRKILVEGWSLELFIEGGRSRTGKLLPPKLGILSMVVDAALQLRDREITFVPVSIGYERIIEASSYAHEQAGGEKQPESIGGLFAANKVLRSKYGRLYLQFGELMSFRGIVDEATALAGKNDRARGAAVDGEASASSQSFSPPQRRALVQRIAHRVTYEINRATVVTPAALAASTLLANRRRGITHDHLLRQAQALLTTLERLGARIAKPVIDDEGQFRPETLDEALRLFEDAKLLVTVDAGSERKKGDAPGEPIYQVPEERRMALEYHKNTVLHFFVPSALIASALLALGGEAELEILRERVRRLSRLFKLEFMYRADADFEEIFEDALASMRESGEVEQSDTHVRRGGGASGAPVARYAEMLRTYFESYRLALISIASLRERENAALTRKEWLKSALALGQRRWLAGQITLRESISRQKLENALAALHDHQIVRIEGDQIRPGAAIEQEHDPLDQMLVEHLVID
ncbi:MAG: 1-acyl-sn-glycerol-3-phosphate acyltransferase [Myxococcota bacterium]|nr:1-acyl-sn-glycerol-3-phosphate acyltransferase [Myxococcota bacterium]